MMTWEFDETWFFGVCQLSYGFLAEAVQNRRLPGYPWDMPWSAQWSLTVVPLKLYATIPEAAFCKASVTQAEKQTWCHRNMHNDRASNALTVRTHPEDDLRGWWDPYAAVCFPNVLYCSYWNCPKPEVARVPLENAIILSMISDCRTTQTRCHYPWSCVL